MAKRRVVLKNLDEAGDIWGGGGVFCRGGSASRAWICPNEKHVLAVLPDIRQAAELRADSLVLFPDRPAYALIEPPLTSDGGRNRPILLERGAVIKRWATGGGLLAATPGALMTPCLLGESEIVLHVGDVREPREFAMWLELNGYQRADLVWSPGQYVSRGFITDVFDPAHAYPIRFEFFDNEIERISSFTPSTQKSVAELEEMPIHSLADTMEAQPANLVPSGSRVLLFDPRRIETQAESFQWMMTEASCAASPGGLPDKNSLWYGVYNELAVFPHVRILDGVDGADAELQVDGLPPFSGDSTNALRTCGQLLEQGYTVSIFTSNPRFLNREDGMFADIDVDLREAPLSSGFADRAAKRAFISDRELSGITSISRSVEWRAPVEWKDRLSNGQMVVHEDYGVGIFRGIHEIATLDVMMDMLVIEFADGEKLLVPVLQSHKLTPLAEHEGDEIKPDSLKGSRWRKNAEKDRERAREEARIVMEIYARRETARREPWPPVDDMYDEFVRAFPHVETADQVRAVAEIMEDLSGPFPMDRLVVGDVGFGKTEIAMRASFRAAAAGKQVCILVPTTILAQQHFATFRSRFAGFPISIGLLSRFVTKREMQRYLKQTEDGSLDILIGTHKMLSGDVNFKNLGLLVVDEEHRFGVMHKESLKRRYGSVDILSLSATPIPRTLTMALRGLRSISVLSAPPENRLPVTTFAGEWDIQIIRRAVAHELNRGGQVYFVSNRISRMESHLRTLSSFFPEAEIHIAHGQMRERELESVMMDFYSGKTDVLIATTIIESGLDVGRANTIIIDDAQELGLAQMYQLRGRVGRRQEGAFAYFFYPSGAELRHETLDRLDAISTMTELGSGYEIARRDLDIRGGGDAAGTSQHGTTRTGSFSMFYRMLEQELAKLRGVDVKNTEVTFDRCGSVPAHYIPQESVRTTLVRRMLRASGVDEIAALAGEMRDRFGSLPDDARLLAALTAIRSFGRRFGIESASVRAGETRLSGSMSELGPLLKAMRNEGQNGGWTVLKSAAVGPGGLKGAEDVFSAMREANKILVKAEDERDRI